MLAILALGWSVADAEQYTIPLFISSVASGEPQGVVRVLNGTDGSGTVAVHAIDDAGVRHGPATFTLSASAAAEFTAAELASGNAAKGLSGGIGRRSGDVRLEIDTDLDIVPLAFVRAPDGTLSAMHDTVRAGSVSAGRHTYDVPIFNPSTDVTQASRLRLINPGDAAAAVTIEGRDDSGAAATGGDVTLTLPAGGARTLTARQLEAGDAGLAGRLGAGTGRWRLTVSSDRPLLAVNIVASTAGYWNNLSTTAVAGAAPADLTAFNERFVGRIVVWMSGEDRTAFEFRAGGRFSATDDDGDTFAGRHGYEATGPRAGRLTLDMDGIHSGISCRVNLYFSSRASGWLASRCLGPDYDGDGIGDSGDWFVEEGQGGGGGGQTTFSTGDTVATLPAGSWTPDVTSGGSFSLSGGDVTVRLDSGGYIEEGEYRYTCQSAGGCEVVNRRVRSGTVAQTAAGAPPGSQPPPAGTADDHGDTFDTATSVSVPSATAGELEEGGDRDYFRVVVAAATALTVETAGGTDTYGTLFAGSGGMMARDDDGGAGNNFRIEESVEPGTYYVEVRGYASSTTGAYELRVSAADADEPPVAGGGEAAYGAGDTVATLPAGFWTPDVTSGGSFGATGGDVTIRLDNGGYIEEGDYRYTCQSAGGCVIENRRVTSGTVVRTASGTAPTGEMIRRLTDHDAVDASPSWSPDGRRIAFHSYRDGNWEVYVMDADGGNPQRLTDHSATDASPSWSPDGRRIAFHSYRDGNWEVYVMDADGTNLRRLTDHDASDRRPSWSPDGRRIAFHSYRDGNWEVYVMDADGGNPQRLTDHSATDTYPSWSPDGRRIAFHSDRDGNWEVYVMDADGGNLRRLTDNDAADGNPSWSPDGRRIAFHSYRDGNAEVYVMDADGGNPRRLTDHDAVDASPSWSPDGRRIAFHSTRDGNLGVYVMDADGDGTGQDPQPRFAAGTSIENKTYTVGTAISELTLPAAGGGDGPRTYSLSPEVPGLIFNATANVRELTGTPTMAGSYEMTYRVRDTDGDTDTLTFTITVESADDGDDRASATRIVVPSDTPGVVTAGDVDYFRVNVSGAGTLEAYTSGWMDTVGRLEDASGSLLESDDDSGDDFNFRIEANVSAGTHYIRVSGYDGVETGDYTLHVRFSESTPGTSPPPAGGACAAGMVVNPGESCTYKGYSFTVNSSGRGSIAFFSAGNSIDARGSTINGVSWNFYASRNSGSNSWTIHVAD